MASLINVGAMKDLWCPAGGSAVASDAIYREVQRLREGGKPVVVSMGNVAASGGYYISGACPSHFFD